MKESAFVLPPDQIERSDVMVMQKTTVNEISSIRAIWASFEQLVGLRGRKMYAQIDEEQQTYSVSTPLLEHGARRAKTRERFVSAGKDRAVPRPLFPGPGWQALPGAPDRRLRLKPARSPRSGLTS